MSTPTELLGATLNTGVGTPHTEYTVGTISTAGVYIFSADLGNLLVSDELELRIRTKIRTGAVSRLAYQAIYNGPQSNPNVYSPPVPITTEMQISVKHNSNIGTLIPWSLLSA